MAALLGGSALHFWHARCYEEGPCRRNGDTFNLESHCAQSTSAGDYHISRLTTA